MRRRATSRCASGSSSSSTSAGGERDELALTAAEGAGRAIELLLGEAEIAQVANRIARRGVAGDALDQRRLALEHARHAVEVAGQLRVGELRLDASELVLERRALGARRGEDLAHRAVLAGDELVQVGDDGALAQRHRSGVGRVVAGGQAQDRRLAGTIGPD
jgi:hypothetical protein